MDLLVNSKNIIGWLRLAVEVVDLPKWQIAKIKSFINRTDIVRRQKELDEIFGGEEWLI
jgi:hypothetical protein